MRSIPVIVVAIAAVASCKADRDKTLSSASTVEDITTVPLRYAGHTVTVTGTVDRVLADRLFEIDGDGILSTSKLLVVTKHAVAFGTEQLRRGDDLVVHGTVRRMDPARLEHELGFALYPDLVRRYRDRAIVVADGLRTVQTGFRWSEDVRDGAIVGFARLMSEISPKLLAGTAVDLEDVPVQATASRGLWIGYGPHAQIFVVPTEPAALTTVRAGDRVDVKGRLREVPAAAELGLDAATARKIAGEPIYVEATELARSAPQPAA